MADDAKKLSLSGRIRGFFKGVKAEYSKIIFPDMDTMKKQSVVVVIVSLFLGALIFVLDFIMKYLLGFVL